MPRIGAARPGPTLHVMRRPVVLSDNSAEITKEVSAIDPLPLLLHSRVPEVPDQSTL